jgi:acyl-CoA reductase-like NAD-dependent aldehyde dehydrogenase
MTAPAQSTPEIRIPDLRPLIDGESTDVTTGRTFEVKNPATGKSLAQLPESGPAEIDRAVAAARAALEGDAWGKMAPTARARLLRRFGDLIESHKEELAALESANNGKTYREALKGDLPPSWEIFHYYAGWCTKLRGETIPVDGPYLNYTLREPMGVCGQIIPWNFPILMASWKLAPALACGNTVVLKPSEITPLTALRLGELAREAGFPKGVVNVVPGLGPVAGEALARHMGVDKLAFTGSTRTARGLLKASAESNLKKLSLELGGKSPHIVFDDADQKPAMNAALWGIFMNKGEVCAAGSRLLVQKGIYDEFVGKLVERVKKMKIGDPFEQGVEMGPVVSERQLGTVLGYIEAGKADGARLLTGGARGAPAGREGGYFVQPTIFDQVSPQMKIAQEEIFGPVLSVIPFENEADAVKIANSTIYGLVAGVWTKDIGRALRMASAIKSGTVWVNDYNAFNAASPFGGYGQSGWGREMGEQAIELYTQTKSVWVRTDR